MEYVNKTLEAANFKNIQSRRLDCTIYLGTSAEEAADESMNLGPLARAMRVQNTDETIKSKIRNALIDYFSLTSSNEIEVGAMCWIVQAKA